jgi:hypothetical protein
MALCAGASTAAGEAQLVVRASDVTGDVMKGAHARIGVGITAAPAGDVNGDGIADLLLGAVTDRHGRGSGTVFVVFGGGRRSKKLVAGGYRGFALMVATRTTALSRLRVLATSMATG